jgi:hypothetical protein
VTPRVYDRELLLGAKRNAVLDLSEIQRYGSNSYADADYVSIYGMRPAEWHAKGIRVLGRTAVECTRDVLADAIGADVARIADTAPDGAGALVIDPFAGSANTLYWLLRQLRGARGVGFERDDAVFELTRENLSVLGLPIEISHADYATALADVDASGEQLVIAFLAPPWGDALSPTAGLDLRRTTPPVRDLADCLIERFRSRLLCAIQVYERLDPDGLAELEARFDWSALRIYDFNAPGENHGVVLATKGWVPSAS